MITAIMPTIPVMVFLFSFMTTSFKIAPGHQPGAALNE